MVARAVLDGLQQEAIATGGDIGESEESLVEELPEATTAVGAEAEVPATELTIDTESGEVTSNSEEGENAALGSGETKNEASVEAASAPGEDNETVKSVD